MAAVRDRNDRVSGAGWYVYGLVPGGTVVDPNLCGVGDPPAPVRVLTYAGVAALVSEIRVDDTFLRPESIVAHKRVLDVVAAAVPVLPVRFGAVLDGRQTVERDLLAPEQERFRAALAVLSGRVQYRVKARYVQDRLLREVLTENSDVALLRDEVDRAGGDRRDLRIRLGAAVSDAVADRRGPDTELLADVVRYWCVASEVRSQQDLFDLVDVALLVDLECQADLQRAVIELGRSWAGRVHVRLLGPMAAYDFAAEAAAGE